MNEWDAIGSIQAGNYSALKGKVRVNVPLVEDKLALMLGAMGELRDGYDNETRSGDKGIGDVNYSTYTAALRYQPTDTIDATFTYDHIRDRSDLPPQNPLIYGKHPWQTWSQFPAMRDISSSRRNCACPAISSRTSAT